MSFCQDGLGLGVESLCGAHVRLIDKLKLILGVSVAGCLAHLSLCCPVMDWWLF